MAKQKYFYPLLLAAATISTSCVDDNYELADLDTTVGVNLNELTIPLNVKSITLDKVLDIEDNSRIQKHVVNGKEIYAFKESNTFGSDKVNIPVLKVTPQSIAPIVNTLDIQIPSINGNGANSRSKQPVCVFPVKTDSKSTFSESGNADPAIVSISSISVEGESEHDYEMHINVGDPNIKKYVNKVYFDNFKLLLPMGLRGKFTLDINHIKKDVTTKYNPKTGELDLSDQTLGATDFDMHIYADMEALNFEDAGNEVTFKNGKFTYSGEVKVLSGEIAIYAEDINTEASLQDIPRTLSYVCTPKIYGVNVTSFTGEVQYSLKDLNIDPVAINDLPEILAQEGTDIKLANPQIYLSIDNPLNSKYGIWAQASLHLQASKNGTETSSALSDIIKIDGTKKVYCLAADTEKAADELLEEYADAEIVKFEGLGNILSGNGVPDKIYVDVLEPRLPRQKVENLALGQDLDEVKGSFMFFAPLALDETSVVSYKKTLDDWYDSSFDDMTITKAAVSADITSEVPASIEFTIQPINRKGNVISGVTCNRVTIAASPDPQPVEIVLTGEIEDLDGIIIDAKLYGNGEAISPDNNIKMDNFKVTVSGQYIDEL